MEKLQSTMNELTDCEIRIGEILHEVAEAEFPNIVCDNLHLILALMSNCKSQINFSETIKYLKKEDAVMVEMCKNCQGINNESSKDVLLNGGTNSTYTTTDNTNPQPGTSKSTKSTKLLNVSYESLLGHNDQSIGHDDPSLGHDEPLVKMEVMDDSDEDDHNCDTNENDPLTLNPVTPSSRPKRKPAPTPGAVRVRKPDASRIQGPPPPPSSKVERPKKKEKEKRDRRGINNLFPPLLGQTVEEKVNIMVRRHDNNYYVDYTLEQIQQLPEIERPNEVVTKELRDEVLSCMSFYRNRNLSWVMKQELQDCQDFRDRLSGFRLTSLSQANDEASAIWKKNSPDYNPALATNIKGSAGVRKKKNGTWKWKRVLIDENDQENGGLNNETSKEILNGVTDYTNINNTNPQPGTSKSSNPTGTSNFYNELLSLNMEDTDQSDDDHEMVTNGSYNPNPGALRNQRYNTSKLRETSSQGPCLVPPPKQSLRPDAKERRGNKQGINNLFPPFLGQTVEEKANILVRRHDNNYYVDFTLGEIQQLPEIERPNQVVTKELRDEVLSKNSFYRNRNLSWVMKQDSQVCQDFRAKLSGFNFTSLAQVRNDATEIWKKNCPDYNPNLATNLKGTGGLRRRKRKRDD